MRWTCHFINDASRNPNPLWTTIKSIPHSSPPNEQLSPPISQSLANSLASFFYQKIVSLKDLIALKLHGTPTTPFDFDLHHSGELLHEGGGIAQAWATWPKGASAPNGTMMCRGHPRCTRVPEMYRSTRDGDTGNEDNSSFSRFLNLTNALFCHVP